jgi:hypothetical protein
MPVSFSGVWRARHSLSHHLALTGFDLIPIVGQVTGAFASGAALTVVAGAVIGRRRRR